MNIFRRFIDWIERKIAMRYIKKHKTETFEVETMEDFVNLLNSPRPTITIYPYDPSLPVKTCGDDDAQKLIDAIEKLCENTKLDDKDFKEIEDELNS